MYLFVERIKTLDIIMKTGSGNIQVPAFLGSHCFLCQVFGHGSQDKVRKQFLQQFYWIVKYDHSTHRTAFDANHGSGDFEVKELQVRHAL